jgi:beta-xylosidase
LSPDGARLEGEMKELIRNDAPWEGNLVEGPFVLRRNEWFYLFYSGNACCGLDCNYALGVARSKALFGPWEKNPANPILAGNDRWKCPGHGSIVADPQGRDFLLYHAYHAQESVYVGRQMLLDEIKWETNGWPTINQGRGPSGHAPAPHGYASHNGELFFTDEFKTGKLVPNWQWPQYNEPKFQIKSDHLELSPTEAHANELAGAVLAIRSTRGDYEAVALVNLSGMKPGVLAGLAAYGDRDNAVGIAVGSDAVKLWRRQKKQERILASDAVRETARLYLRLNATAGHQFQFATSSDGRQWKDIGPGIDTGGNDLPPWDRGVRVALTASGAENVPARFDWFRLYPALIK